MAATARMSIALPVELKDRMKAVAKSNVVNWSKVCRRPIESELAFLEGQTADEAAAIERLCMSKLESEHRDTIEGKAAGRERAQHTADYNFLKRLQRSVDLHLYDRSWDRLRRELDPQGESTDEKLCVYLFGDDYDDLDDIPNNSTFLDAFIEGAIGAWQKLAPKIEGAHRPPITENAPQLPVMPSPNQSGGAAVRVVAPLSAAETSAAAKSAGAHPAVQATDGCAANSPGGAKPEGCGHARAGCDYRGSALLSAPRKSASADATGAQDRRRRYRRYRTDKHARVAVQ
jgi:hypothetical protein